MLIGVMQRAPQDRRDFRLFDYQSRVLLRHDPVELICGVRGEKRTSRLLLTSFYFSVLLFTSSYFFILLGISWYLSVLLATSGLLMSGNELVFPWTGHRSRLNALLQTLRTFREEWWSNEELLVSVTDF